MPEISDEEFKKFQDAQKSTEALAATKARLEDENSKIKKRAQEAESKLSEAEQKKLEDEGETSKLLLLERDRAAKLEEKLQGNTKMVLNEKLRTEVSKFAKDAHDVDMLLRVKEHKDLLKLNEDELSISGVEEFVTKVRETHNFLFSGKQLPDYDNKKGGDNGQGGNNDPNNSMTEEQKYRAELKTVSTRKELSDVRKKYGKDLDSLDSIY